MPSKPLQSIRTVPQFGRHSIGLFDDQSILFALAVARDDVQNDADVAREFHTNYPDWSKHTLPSWKEDEPIPSNTPIDLRDWQRGQKLLRDWLPNVARFDRLMPKRRTEVLYAVNEMLSMFDSHGSLFIGPAGLEFRSDSGGESVLGLCVRSMVRFMVPSDWPPSRLGRCANPKCKQWFIRPPPKRGTVRRYCSDKHANSARAMQFRRRKKKEAATK